ncbi:uncharacterized protein LOC105358836 [Oryzias latipes]|uniref:uncharacterized protein LOC105358836 n=1 Tax=Oryzias latipes TaxID=8090 RepID=UPI0005CB8B96|nr:uncharacterized protein LOC105358836 [Oryzias latipes]
MLSWWAVAVVLCLPCGLSYHAQRLYTDVEHGQSLLLHCDGSAYRDKEGMVHWEQQGEVVVVLRGEETTVAESLRGRVRLPSEEQMRKGNWSLVISKVTASDDDVYFCFFNNATLISSVWVRVLENDEATVDDTTKKTLWTIDGSGVGTTDVPFLMEVFTQTMKVVTDSQPVGTTDKSTPWTDSHLVDTTDKSTPWTDSHPVDTTDKSTPWTDSYPVDTTDKSTPWTDSHPVDTTDKSTPWTDSHPVDTTDKSTPWKGSQSMGTTDKSTPWKGSQSMGTTDKSTPWINSQPIGSTDKSTPFSDRDEPRVTTDSPLLESFPWVRIGLIGGVLLGTLLVMGLLGALQQI